MRFGMVSDLRAWPMPATVSLLVDAFHDDPGIPGIGVTVQVSPFHAIPSPTWSNEGFR